LGKIAPGGAFLPYSGTLRSAYMAEDEAERDLQPDWMQAKLVLSEPKQSVHLRLEQETIDFFKAQGKGHISRMQAVLRAYVTAHRSR
jgi:uncharacterized protein (DUF4415 family)